MAQQSEVRDGLFRGSSSSKPVAVDELERSASALLTRALAITGAASILNVGFGQGAWLRAATRLGVSDLWGVDRPGVSPLVAFQQKTSSCDIHGAFSLSRRFDLVTCLDFAGQFPEADHASLVGSLTEHGDVVLFAAPAPHEISGNFPGFWPDYWAKIFHENGFLCCDELRSELWNEPGIAWRYRQDVLLFIKQDVWFSSSRLKNLRPTPAPLSLVHPESLESRARPNHALQQEILDPQKLQAAAEAAYVAGESNKVVEFCSAVIDCGTANATIHHLMGLASMDLGQNFVAAEHFGQALALAPNHLGVRLDFSKALMAVGMHADAVSMLLEAEKLFPDDPDLGIMLFSALSSAGKDADALIVLENLHAKHPGNVGFTAGLAAWYDDHGDMTRAFNLMMMAAAQDPNSAQIQIHLAKIRERMGQEAQAVPNLERAVELDPDNTRLHLRLASALLSDSLSIRGFEELEWHQHFPGYRPPAAGIRRWSGQPLKEARLLITAELGPSEMIQFARFIPALARLDPRGVFVECHRGLEGLFSTIEGVSDCVAVDTAFPAADYAVPILSLPTVLSSCGLLSDVETPYLQLPKGVYFPIPAERAVKIGVSWQGESGSEMFDAMSEVERSCPLLDLTPLSYVRGSRLYSLEVGSISQRLREARIGVIDLAPVIPDFTTLAAAIARMDVVVSVNNHVAHLAAALGKPVWLLLNPQDKDYRWRESAHPWYPTARVFRGEWPTIMLRLVEALTALTEKTVGVPAEGG